MGGKRVIEEGSTEEEAQETIYRMDLWASGERCEEHGGFGWVGEQWGSGRLRLPEAGANLGKGMEVVVALDEGGEVGRSQSQRVLYSM